MSPGRGCGGRSPPAPAGATGSTHSTAAMQAATRIAFISRPPVGWGEHIRRSGACQIREELAAEAAPTFRRRRVRTQIGRAHVCTPVTNAHIVCRLLLEKKKTNKT